MSFRLSGAVQPLSDSGHGNGVGIALSATGLAPALGTMIAARAA